ncbi:hypothetical protein [Bacteroides thetaiotaomicron]|uniref:hypothetical protein n=1 Tax=Bacteroides thetaiotaomicron TaxID=818 RepID=UPI00321B6DAE
MNAKQIQLYCIKEDYYLLDKYFREKQIFISAMPLSGFDLRPIQVSDFDENDWNRVIVYKEKHSVEIEEIESVVSFKKIFTPNFMISDILTFDRAYIDVANKKIVGGNISGITKYLTDGVLLSKSNEFLKWQNAFYLWIKRNFIAIKIDKIHNVYVSERVRQMIDDGYILE